MLEWPFGHLLDAAAAKAAAVPALKDSMRRHDANDVGALGEVIVADYLAACGVPVEDVSESSRTHDFVTPLGTVEVKTKERRVRPMLTYECSIADLQRGRELPGWYFFVSVRSDGGEGWGRFKQAWVLGTIEGDRFWRVAEFWKPGMRAENGWKPTIACWNVTVSQLRPPKNVGRV